MTVLVAAACWSVAACGQESVQEKPAPQQENVPYGPHQRNVLDFWQAEPPEPGTAGLFRTFSGAKDGPAKEEVFRTNPPWGPTPLVVYIHGGAFRGGSKESLDAGILRELLAAGISVAAVNYRLVSHAPLPAAHDDCRRALQFLRWKATQWNIDKTRVGAFGGSAGAQLCMYLAFHDDLADPESEDPVARESTRLTCVATSGGQTTMDVDWWQQHIPGYDTPHRDFFVTFGVQTKHEYLNKVADVSALALISKDDVPIFMSYSMNPDDPVPGDPQRGQSWKVHHVVFGVKLKEQMDALGIEAALNYSGARTRYRSAAHFLIEKLTKRGNQAETDDVETSGRADSIPNELRTYSTIQSIGMEWDLTGDANHNAACQVHYRPEGAEVWEDALSLLRVDCFNEWSGRKADRAYNMLAGSVFFLQPDTAYQVRLALSDPDGGSETRMVSIRTRPVPTMPKGGTTYHVTPGTGGGEGSEQRPFQGLETAQAAARAGDVFLLHPGDYGRFAFTKSGQPGNYLVWRAAGDGDAVFEHVDVAASHLWIEGLLFQGAGGTALQAARTTDVATLTDVVLSRNRFRGFHHSIVLNRRASNWHIADNVIVGDMVPGKPLPAKFTSGEGIELARSSGHVVAHNRISHVADGISYCERNCDIFGNDIFDCVDDGVEPDYGYANNRIWGNRFHNTGHYAFSFQPQFCGPWYFIRNQVITGGGLFKLNYPMDCFVLVNNTFVCWGGVRRPPVDILRSYSRNNLYVSLSDGGHKNVAPPVWSTRGPWKKPNLRPTWQTDVDYDGFDWGRAPIAFFWDGKEYANVAEFAEALGIQKHGLRVCHEQMFEKAELRRTPAESGPQALTLRQGSRAVDAGAVVPNLNDRFIGKAPDLGAHEFGKPSPRYGPRPPEVQAASLPKLERPQVRRRADGTIPPFPAEPAPTAVCGQGITVRQLDCGALLRDSFQTPYLHPDLWRSFSADPSVSYEIDNGVLRVYGIEGPASNSNRLFSKHFYSDDAVLVCKMRANSLTPGQGRTMYRIHYCGQLPDRYTEVALENYAGDLRWRFWGTQLGEARYRPEVVVRTLPAEEVEIQQFYELMIERDGPTSTYFGFVNLEGQWRQVGQPIRTVGPLMKVELKWWAEAGCPVDVEFTHCRVYPNPKRHPLKFFVENPWEMGTNVCLEVWTADNQQRVGTAALDGVGVARIPLDQAPWKAYPVAAVFKLLDGDQEIGSATLAASGLTGIYPDDLWQISLPDSPSRSKQRPLRNRER